MSNAARKITEREETIRAAAIAAAYGEDKDCLEPREPSDAEALYLRARESFKAGRQCNGWDSIDAADAIVCPERLPSQIENGTNLAGLVWYN